jgi:RimJ/RimL family protein N-acetyltransferase
MRLILARCVVRSFEWSDAASITQHADNRAVWINLRDLFPHPYTRKDANRWIMYLHKQGAAATEFAIDVGGEVIGSIGFRIQKDMERHSAEIAYWVGQGYWGRGIATEALRALTDYAFSHYEQLLRIYAYVFEWNTASMRVLEKCGYEREGWLRKSTIKDGKVIDQALYAKLRDSVEAK